MDGNTLIGTEDCLLVKYNSAGAKQWTKTLGVASKEADCDQVAIHGNNLYLAGYTEGNLGGQTLTGTWDMVLNKYDLDGNRASTTLWGVSGASTYSGGVAVDSNGNVFVGGDTDVSLPGHTLVGSRDAFAVMYNADGTTKVWSNQFGVGGGTTTSGRQSIAVDGNGNVYLVGETSGSLTGQSSIGTKESCTKASQRCSRRWARNVNNSGSPGPAPTK